MAIHLHGPKHLLSQVACDQYGVCFGGEEAYDQYIALKAELDDNQDKLKHWTEAAEAIEAAKHVGDQEALDKIEVPEPGKDDEYRKEVDRLAPLVAGLRSDAYERGQDPRNRALELGREWKEGDGF